MYRRICIAVVSATLVLAAPNALAQSVASEKPVATLVVIRTPAGITRPMLEGGFKQALPVYQKNPRPAAQIFHRQRK